MFNVVALQLSRNVHVFGFVFGSYLDLLVEKKIPAHCLHASNKRYCQCRTLRCLVLHRVRGSEGFTDVLHWQESSLQVLRQCVGNVYLCALFIKIRKSIYVKRWAVPIRIRYTVLLPAGKLVHTTTLTPHECRFSAKWELHFINTRQT